jgi:hypothetical protein
MYFELRYTSARRAEYLRLKAYGYFVHQLKLSILSLRDSRILSLKIEESYTFVHLRCPKYDVATSSFVIKRANSYQRSAFPR